MEEDEEEGEIQDFEFLSIQEEGKAWKEKIWKNLKVNDNVVKFEVDTGAAVSLMFIEDARRLFKGSPINKTNINLVMVPIWYCSSKIDIIGFVKANVSYNNKIVELKLYLSKINHTPILGREWFYKLLEISNLNIFFEN